MCQSRQPPSRPPHSRHPPLCFVSPMSFLLLRHLRRGNVAVTDGALEHWAPMTLIPLHSSCPQDVATVSSSPRLLEPRGRGGNQLVLLRGRPSAPAFSVLPCSSRHLPSLTGPRAVPPSGTVLQGRPSPMVTCPSSWSSSLICPQIPALLSAPPLCPHPRKPQHGPRLGGLPTM